MSKVAGDASSVAAAYNTSAGAMRAAQLAAEGVDAAMAQLDATEKVAASVSEQLATAREQVAAAFRAEMAAIGESNDALARADAFEKLAIENAKILKQAKLDLVEANKAVRTSNAMTAEGFFGDDPAVGRARAAARVAQAQAQASVNYAIEEGKEIEASAIPIREAAAAALDREAEAAEVTADALARVDVLEKAETATSRELALAKKQLAASEEEAAAAADASTSAHRGLLSSITGLLTGIVGLTVAYVGLREISSTITATAQYGDQVRLLSTALQVTTEQASQYLFQASQVGLSTQTLTTAFDGFIRRLQGANDEFTGTSTTGKAALQAMHDLGIATQDASGELLPFPQIIQNVRQELQGLPADATKVQAVLDLFTRGGSGGGGVQAGALVAMLTLTNEQIAAMNAQAEKLHLVLDSQTVASLLKFNQVSAQVNSSVLAIKIAIGEQLIPYLQQLEQWFNDNAVSIAAWASKATTDVIAFFKNELIPDLEWIIEHHTEVEIAIAAMGAGIALTFGPGGAAYLAIAGLIALIIDLKNRADSFTPPTTLSKDSTFNGLLSERDALEKNLEFASQNGGSGGTSIASLIKGALGAVGIHGGPDANFVSADDLRGQLAAVNAQIAAMTTGPADGFASGPGNPKFRLPAPSSLSTGQVGNVFDPGAAAAGKKAAEELAAHLNLITNAMADGIITYKEFLSINEDAAKKNLPGLTSAMAGQMEAERLLADGTDQTAASIFNLEKNIGALNDVADQGAEAIARIEQSMISGVMDKLDAAAKGIFAKPTVEQATLQMQSSLVAAQIAQNKIGDMPMLAAGDRMTNALKAQVDTLQLSLTGLTAATDAQTTALADQKELLQLQLRDLLPGQNETKRQLQMQIDGIDAHTKAIKLNEAQTRAGMETEVKTKQDMIQTIASESKGVGQNLKDLAANLADQMAVQKANQQVLKDQLVLADQNTITDKEQADAAKYLVTQIHDFSGKLMSADDILGVSVIRSYQAAGKAVDDFTEAVKRSNIGLNGGVTSSASGVFDSGGTVGRTGWGWLQRGEQVLSSDQQGQGGGVNMNFYGPVTLHPAGANGGGSPADLLFRRTGG